MTDLPPVTVGIDGTPGSDLALDWAADEAAARGVALRVVSAYSWGLVDPWTVPHTPLGFEIDAVRAAAEHRVRSAVERARERMPDLEVEGAAMDGIPGYVLRTESAEACVLVIGSRQPTALGAVVLGSVAAYVAPRSECPVVVLCAPPGDPAEGAAVVVGVDGTEDSETLLAFAFEYASRHRLPLHAVLCSRPDLLAAMQWRPEPPAPERAETLLAEVMAGWQEKYPDVHATRAVVREHPVTGLTESAQAQQLLVVGTRGRHALAGTLLGSVSQGVLHHATCPVVVVPTHRE